MSPRDLDAATVQRRVEHLLVLLADLRSTGEVTAARLEQERLLRHGIERILTQLVDLAVAINSHLAATLLGRGPEDYRSSFQAAASAGVISKELANRLQPSVGLRNILVHDYVPIDLRVVAKSVRVASADYADYCTQVGTWLAARGETPGG